MPRTDIYNNYTITISARQLKDAPPKWQPIIAMSTWNGRGTGTEHVSTNTVFATEAEPERGGLPFAKEWIEEA